MNNYEQLLDAYIQIRKHLELDYESGYACIPIRKIPIIEIDAVADDVLTVVQPVAWIRYRADGGIEGPILHSQMEEVRIRSGAWSPLYSFPDLAAARREREECAKICDTTPPQPFRPSIEAAHAIRARGSAS